MARQRTIRGPPLAADSEATSASTSRVETEMKDDGELDGDGDVEMEGASASYEHEQDIDTDVSMGILLSFRSALLSYLASMSSSQSLLTRLMEHAN